jgi:hypothetical protein
MWCTMMLHVLIDTILSHVGQWRSLPFRHFPESAAACLVAGLSEYGVSARFKDALDDPQSFYMSPMRS